MVAKSALKKAINIFEENAKILDTHNDSEKSTKTRLAAELMESLELLDKKGKKLADAKDEVIISCKDEDLSKTKDGLIEEVENEEG